MKFTGEFFKNLVGLADACTRYTAAGATAGGIAALLALLFQANEATATAVGVAVFFIPMGLLYWWFTSERSMIATFQKLDRWKQSKHITADQHRELKAAALRWYSRRLFGRSGEPPLPAVEEKATPNGN